MAFVFAAFSAATVFFLCWRLSLRYWARRGVVHKAPNLIFGNLLGILVKRHISEILQDLYTKYGHLSQGPFIGFFAYLHPMVLLLDLELIQQVMIRSPELFAERNLYHYEKTDPLSMNLMQLDSKQWQKLRCKVNHCFSKNQLPKLFNGLMRVSDTYKISLRDKLKSCNVDGGVVINDLVDCWNIDVISEMAFGLPGDTLRHPSTTFASMAHNCWQKLNHLKIFIAFAYPTLARLLGFRFYDKAANAYFTKLIDDKMLERQADHLEHNDFLQLFSQSNTSDTCLTRKEIVAQSFSFIACGLEACNSTLAFCLYELGHAPKIQQRARDEIENVMDRHNNKLSFEALQEMTYLKQILYETLRLYTPHSFLLRSTLSDYEIPNSVWMLCKGQRLIIPIAAIHRDENIYPQPLEFDPERFEKTKMRERHACSFLPFGSWPRNCPAQGFVEMQLMVCLVTFLRDYKFNSCGDSRVPAAVDPTQLLLKPKQQITLFVEHLKND